MPNEEHVYLCLMRPPMPGAVPNDGLLYVQEHDGRSPVSGHHTWGLAVYKRQLSAEEVDRFELEYLGKKMEEDSRKDE